MTGHDEEADFFEKRSGNWKTLWKDDIGFMVSVTLLSIAASLLTTQSQNARFENGSWTNESVGWTEGDHWAYSFNVMHDIPGLISLMGRDRVVTRLDEHFAQGHNDHTNEPSHHISYLYTAIPGLAWKTQEKVRDLARDNYFNRIDGLL